MQGGRRAGYIPSVSDLYGTDEIDVLLEEIRDLEPATCRPDDVQDFEIAGSRTAVANLESPGTVRSWDSHANYRHHTGTSPTGSLFSGVILYCDDSQLRSTAGILRIILVVSIVACLACLCSSGSVKVGLFMLPLAGRLRFMLFVTVFSLLITCLFLFLDISHVVYLFPLPWGKVSAILYVSISVLYLIGSSLVVQMVHDDSFAWVAKSSKDQLLITGILGYLCGLEGILISLATKCHHVQYCPVDDAAPPLMLEESRDGSHRERDESHGERIERNEKQVERSSARRPPALTQTRRQPPRTTPNPPSSTNSWPIDDVQPCSSKSIDPYSMA